MTPSIIPNNMPFTRLTIKYLTTGYLPLITGIPVIAVYKTNVNDPFSSLPHFSADKTGQSNQDHLAYLIDIFLPRL